MTARRRQSPADRAAAERRTCRRSPPFQFRADRLAAVLIGTPARVLDLLGLRQARDVLAAIGADELPVTVVHGDFHEQNVHYEHGHLAGVIDFGLTHLDSRPYELAIARTWRSPETIAAYGEESGRCGGDYDLAMIERQLSRTGTPPP